MVTLDPISSSSGLYTPTVQGKPNYIPPPVILPGLGDTSGSQQAPHPDQIIVQDPSGSQRAPHPDQIIVVDPSDKLKQDFQALKKALDSGDLTQAKQAFATLQQDIQNILDGQNGQQASGIHHHHRHHHGYSAQPVAGSSPVAGSNDAVSAGAAGNAASNGAGSQVPGSSVNVQA